MLRRVTKPNWSDRHHIEIRGMKRLLKILPELIPRLVTKAAEAELVMEWIESRMKRPMRQPYNDRELAIVQEVRNLKLTRHK